MRGSGIHSCKSDSSRECFKHIVLEYKNRPDSCLSSTSDSPQAIRLLIKRRSERYGSHMTTIVEIEQIALSLPEKERATLAANLLESLPGVLSDEDDGVAEALRRDAEIETNPDQTISLAQLNARIKSRRG